MKQLRNLILGSLLLFGFSTVALPAAAAYATPKSTVCTAIGGCTNNANSSGSISGVVKLVINVLSIVVGFTAVIMIIVSGLKFMTSGGNPQNVAAARSTITYAIIGLLLVAIAQTIVRFVLQKVSKT